MCCQVSILILVNHVWDLLVLNLLVQRNHTLAQLNQRWQRSLLVRGGYSAPRFFEPRSYDFSDMLNINTVMLYCDAPECDFSVDNTYGDGKWRDGYDAVQAINEDNDGNLLCSKCGKILKADMMF